VVRLPNGNTLVACADAGKQTARVFEIDHAGKTVWEVAGDELLGVSLKSYLLVTTAILPKKSRRNLDSQWCTVLICNRNY
jgi:hypothetical protein